MDRMRILFFIFIAIVLAPVSLFALEPPEIAIAGPFVELGGPTVGCACRVNATDSEATGHRSWACMAALTTVQSLSQCDLDTRVSSCPCVPTVTNRLTSVAVPYLPSSSLSRTLTAALFTQLANNSKSARLLVRRTMGDFVVASSLTSIPVPSTKESATVFTTIRNALLPDPDDLSTYQAKLVFDSNIDPTSGIDDTLKLSANGRNISVQGPLTCPADQSVSIWVTATQSETGAFARELWKGTCTGETQMWKSLVKSEGKVLFSEGDAEVCAAAVFSEGQQPNSSEQWCQQVDLFEE